MERPSGQQSRPGYRGEDRRSTRAQKPSPKDLRGSALGVWALAGSAVVSFAIVPLLLGNDSQRAVELVNGAAALLAAAVGVLAVVRWRLVGEAPAAVIGAALLVLAVALLLVVGQVPVQPARGADRVWLWGRFVGLATVGAMIAYALRTTPVNARISPMRVFGLTAGAVIAGTAGAVAVDAAISPAGESTVWWLHSSVIIVGFVALAVACLVRSWRRPARLFGWLGVLALGLAVAEMLQLAAVHGDTAWAVGAGVMRIGALLYAADAAYRDVKNEFDDHGSQMLRTLVDRQAVEARLEAEEALRRRRAHDVRGALTAIGGATQTLERYRDRLDEEVKDRLRKSVGGEIARLQQLVTPLEATPDPAPFPVAAVLVPVLTDSRRTATVVHCDIPDDLVALGRSAATVAAVRAVLDHVGQTATGGPVTVRAGRSDGEAVIEVVDETGDAGDAGSAGGDLGAEEVLVAVDRLAMFAAAKMMRDQGGQLVVETRSDGGGLVTLRLPLADADAVVDGARR
jgi:signal transduction histidine kinase